MSAAERTSIAPPRQRDFLPASRGERMRALCWAVVRRTLFRWSPPPMHQWRVWLLRRFGAKIGSNVRIEPSAIVEFPWRLSLGTDVAIAHRAILNCMGEVEIGPRTRISQYVHVVAGTHDYTRPDMLIVRRPVTIGAGCWLAADAFIGPGVTVGDRVVVAARSSVFHDLPAGMICAGEPATVRKARPANRAGVAGPRSGAS